MGISGDNPNFRIYKREKTHALLRLANIVSPFLYTRGYEYDMPPLAPMNHVKIFKGWPLQDAPSKLVQLWYKSFPQGRFLPGGNEEANYVE